MKIFAVLLAILILVIFLFVCLWIYGFNEANDLSVPTKDIFNLKGIKKVLLIFPHPDDEAFSLSGTITRLVKKGIKVDWVILTRGERGNEDSHYDNNLKGVRNLEAQHVAKILGVSRRIQKDYPDDHIDAFKSQLTDDLKETIKSINPDLVITYDESGGYGHPDHIIVSKVVTSLVQNNFPSVHLWYTSTPKKVFNELSLPVEMAKSQQFIGNRKLPNFKVWIKVSGLVNKIKVVYTYQSQFASFVKSVPIKQIPLWFYLSLTPYEYFYEVK